MNIESIDPNNEVTSVAEDAIRAETGVAGEVNEGATAEGRSNEAAAEDKGSLYPLLLKSLLTGVLVALFVSFFRWGIPQIMGLVSRLLVWARGNVLYSIVFVGIFILIGLLVSFCTKKEPMIGGSGIPQVSGILQDKLNLSWWKIFVNKLLAGLLAIGSGLSLGREGPSVQIGGALGQGVGELSHSSKADSKMLLAGGAGAGMAVAFNAPISGLFFTVEELFHQTSHRKFMSLALTVLTRLQACPAFSLATLLVLRCPPCRAWTSGSPPSFWD
ncbi:MAG: chloride channel protein [Eubacteriales bacterium]|nr:chloride channel protein [Eubacteriales bacterium]